jgi:hypothetical protein
VQIELRGSAAGSTRVSVATTPLAVWNPVNIAYKCRLQARGSGNDRETRCARDGHTNSQRRTFDHYALDRPTQQLCASREVGQLQNVTGNVARRRNAGRPL